MKVTGKSSLSQVPTVRTEQQILLVIRSLFISKSTQNQGSIALRDAIEGDSNNRKY